MTNCGQTSENLEILIKSFMQKKAHGMQDIQHICFAERLHVTSLCDRCLYRF